MGKTVNVAVGAMIVVDLELQPIVIQIGVTFSAHGPFGPWPSV